MEELQRHMDEARKYINKTDDEFDNTIAIEHILNVLENLHNALQIVIHDSYADKSSETTQE